MNAVSVAECVGCASGTQTEQQQQVLTGPGRDVWNPQTLFLEMYNDAATLENRIAVSERGGGKGREKEDRSFRLKEAKYEAIIPKNSFLKNHVPMW